jgi:hypothetical protein
MKIINKLKAAATKEVVGSVLKSGTAPTEKAVGWKAKAISVLTVVAAAVAAALSYLQS